MQADQNSAKTIAVKMLRSFLRFLGFNPYMWVLIYTPIVAQAIFCLVIIICDVSGFRDKAYPILLIVSAIVIGLTGYFRSKKLEVKDSYFKTYFAFFLALIIATFNFGLYYTMDIWVWSGYYDYAIILENLVLILNANFIFALFIFAFVFSGFSFFPYALAIYAFFAIGFMLGLYRKKQAIANKKPIYISFAVFCVFLVIPITLSVYKSSYMIADDLQKMPPLIVLEEHQENLYFQYSDYKYKMDNITPLRGDPAIYFENNPPKLSGAIALCPIYYSAAEALYKKPDNLEIFDYNAMFDYEYKYLACSSSPEAYRRLFSGEADMIFALEPSEDQLKEAQEKGIDLDLTPIAKEAFTFLVNNENLIKSLTIEQIQKIYTGEITNWREVGGANEKILAFQRNSNSGSQTAMENSVMKGLLLKRPLQEEIFDSMSGLVDVVADYRNAKNAIGYSFRYYVTDMQKKEEVRLLEINGVEPNVENIQNGSYPLIHDFYIVTRKDDVSKNAQKLIDWFLSD
ncbi:MAG: substrate-binding domain-containing protein, partial [Helicobacteraceae bacterium]|nr:substrate-binding domain-containing protein [Helicobacteraceae bacterium]